jgi:predicted RNA-binding protein with PIN domain
MPTLIDGYNLLHAMGRLTARAGKQALEGARRSLLLRVRARHQPGEGDDVTVVFDASGAPPSAPGDGEFNGIHVKFARGQTADDLIEDLIRADACPRLLTVVSDDHRIQNAARRRGCKILGCLDYCEDLQRRAAAIPPASPEPPAKPESSTPEETQHWLDAFTQGDEPPGDPW